MDIISLSPDPVVVKKVDQKLANPAFVTLENGVNRIVISIPWIDMWAKKWAVKLPKEDIEKLKDIIYAGLLAHECAHIRYETFSLNHPLELVRMSDVLHYIDNVLEDTRIEYKLAYEFPEVAKYIEFINDNQEQIEIIHTNPFAPMFTTFKADIDKLNGKMMLAFVNTMMNVLYRLAKFNIVPSMDEFGYKSQVMQEFIDLCYPRIVCAKRGTRQDVIQSSCEIYFYLIGYLSDVFKDDLSSLGTKPKKKNTSEDDKDLQNKTQQALEDIIKETKVEVSPDGNVSVTKKIRQKKSPNADDTYIPPTDDGTFYRQVVTKYARQIQELSRLLLRDKLKLVMHRTFDGDLSLDRQQEAYFASMVDESAKNYFTMKHNKISGDVCVLRDVSFSTQDFMQQYAVSACMFAAAVEQTKQDVRLAIIDFAGIPLEIKKFSQPLSTGELIPRCLGGTILTGAFEKMRNLGWRDNVKKTCILITDGETSWNDIPKFMVEPIYNNIRFIGVFLGGSYAQSYHEFKRNCNEILRCEAINVKNCEELPVYLAAVLEL